MGDITEKRLARIRQVLAARRKDLALVLDNIHDPHNVSAILRSCDAFGVPRVHLHYTATPFPHLGRKSSASARKWVECVRHADAASLVARLQSDGLRILAAGFGPRAVPLCDWDLTRPTAIVLGSEHDGVSEDLAGLAAGELYIPMRGMVQSLNVSVAAAIILHEAQRQRAAKGMYDRPSFSPEEIAALTAVWRER
ncbi:TrmH family RNA methyltransferase [Desulfolutivibrio sulfoxidireducens]|uniref:TrmH family RNA methyltransferase n=1 Tax=Desulfolutivibrio sulfoxidireducens TaxID=2773299 RepID=UPI00159E237A|nr:TrmH family RNA methyltransferase [Desulfolutivibrio sulfoxidireducens]QLA15664.1 tRNA methyltransferase [Desulfolutivibrio sulfoxidireducens]QLA19270.1 tRNA methyltransferase [Desulfolutivibrio sulfoxidireducens]